MSTPTMNHISHMQQQQQQQTNEAQDTHSNSSNSPHATLKRSDSTSTVILEEEEAPTSRRTRSATQPPSIWPNFSMQLRSFLKTSGLFNKDLETSDKWDELFASGNEFTLQRFLSEVGVNDININMNEFKKFDSNKLLDARTLSEFLRSESFDQLMASATNNTEVLSVPLDIAPSSSSFPKLRSLSPELTTNNVLLNPSTYSPATSASDQNALNAFEHDHAFLSKRTHTRSSRRTSNRIQARDIGSTKSKNNRNVNRATDIKSTDDLTNYLERRRKNNEASKISRASRKQKFGTMDQQCDEYDRVNAELRMKITTLEKVTASLKSGLVNNFQRRNAV